MESHAAGRTAPVMIEDCLDSTNTRLKALAACGAVHGTVLIARRQTGGRGRLGRGFESPPEGLYLSMLLRPDCPPERTLSITPLAAVAVCRAAESCAGVSPDIKWPNDVLLDGKKLCGILTELVVRGQEQALVVGIGVNVNTPEDSFSPELRGAVCSLRSYLNRKIDLELFSRCLISELDGLYARWETDEGALLDEYRRRCVTCGQDIFFFRGEIPVAARALAINEDFSLRVETAEGIEQLRFGEVTVRRAGAENQGAQAGRLG